MKNIIKLLYAVGADVFCSDLKEILPLMRINIENNQKIIENSKGNVKILELDWANEKISELFSQNNVENIDFIVASDVIFNKTHLKLFTNVCNKFLSALFSVFSA